MEKSHISVALIGTSSEGEAFLQSALSDDIFRVEHLEYHGGKDLSVSGDAELIILYHNKTTESRLFWQGAALLPKENVPVILLSSSSHNDFIGKFLSSGIHTLIQLPCTKEYLVERLHDILQRWKPDESTETVTVEIPWKGKNLSSSMTTEQLSNLTSSLLENNIHQQSILNKAHLSSHPYVSEKDSSHMKEIKEMAVRVKKAMANHEFQLYFQPVHSLKTGKLTGFESLIRWIDPDKGLIPPDDFIPQAEQSDIIIDLGFWIIDEAIERAIQFNEEYHGDVPLYVNINLSARQFNHPNLAEVIVEKVNSYGIDPSLVNFEITEGAFMDDMEQANLMLLKLKKEGFKIYMDDFGTGYSSLTYLLHFPVDCLKVDKSFVQWMHLEEESKQIVHSVIFLAHNLGIVTVCEGVESEEHIEMLKEMKSDYVQGYFYSKPLPVKDALEYIASQGT